MLTALAWSGNGLATGLQGSEWRPVRMGMGGVMISRETDAFVQFRSRGRLEGSGGCNRFFAEYRAEHDQLMIGPVAATRMACARPLMEFEAALAATLENARGYLRMRHKLLLFDGNGSAILEMRQTDWD